MTVMSSYCSLCSAESALVANVSPTIDVWQLNASIFVRRAQDAETVAKNIGGHECGPVNDAMIWRRMRCR